MLVLIVDDHPLFRLAVRCVIEDCCPLWKIREASTGEEALDIMLREPVSVAILDIMLPDQSGLHLLKQIKRVRPQLPCLMLTAHSEPRYADLSLQLGAAGFLMKDAGSKELIQGLRAVLSGGKAIAKSLADRLAGRRRADGAAGSSPVLSARELEVLALFAMGRTVSQAAEQLRLSVKTVSTYWSRLLEKLNLNTTADLIRYAVDHCLVK